MNYSLAIPGLVLWESPPEQTFTLTILRDGVATDTQKSMILYRYNAGAVQVVTSMQGSLSVFQVKGFLQDEPLRLFVNDPEATEPRGVANPINLITTPTRTVDLTEQAVTVTTGTEVVTPPPQTKASLSGLHIPAALNNQSDPAMATVRLRVRANGLHNMTRFYQFTSTNVTNTLPAGIESMLYTMPEDSLSGWVRLYVNIDSSWNSQVYVNLVFEGQDVDLMVDFFPDGKPNVTLTRHPRGSNPDTWFGGGAVASPVQINVEPLRYLTMQVLREGVETPERKLVKILDNELSTTPRVTFWIVNGYDLTLDFVASAIDGERFIQAIDETPPKVGSLRWPVFDQDITMRFNLSEGSGGGGTGGDDATFEALVRVNNLPSNREVVVLQREIDGAWSLAGKGISTEDGQGTINLKVLPDASVYAVAVDNWGRPYQPNLPVVLGDVIRPSTYVGWVYTVTQAGTLPATEPLWWPADEINASRPVGTARVVATRYYRPLAHGPIAVEVVP